MNRMATSTAADPQALEQYRTELTGYCYRMLGSAFEAEDAVQETMLRAWRALDKFEGRSQLRSWIYSIATNVCLDVLGGKERKVRPMQLGDAGEPVFESLAATRPDGEWILPMPDGRVVDDGGDPAEVAASKETLKLAFVAALQFLPPKQRAVLILRDVLVWRAEEVAELLDTSVPAVNSALQRARATVREVRPGEPLDDRARALLDRYCDAFSRYDVAEMVALLHTDATTSMPPFAWWLRGREMIHAALRHSEGSCAGARLVPVAMNGSLAARQLRPTGPGGAFEPFALMIFETSGGLFTDITTFLGPGEEMTNVGGTGDSPA